MSPKGLLSDAMHTWQHIGTAERQPEATTCQRIISLQGLEGACQSQRCHLVVIVVQEEDGGPWWPQPSSRRAQRGNSALVADTGSPTGVLLAGMLSLVTRASVLLPALWAVSTRRFD